MGDEARTLAVLHADDGSLASDFAPRELDDRILALRFSPDGKQLAVATSSALHQFDIVSGGASKAIPRAWCMDAPVAVGTAWAYESGPFLDLAPRAV